MFIVESYLIFTCNFTGFGRRMKLNKAERAAHRRFRIFFHILMQATLLTKEATIVVDSQSEICWGTDWKK